MLTCQFVWLRLFPGYYLTRGSGGRTEVESLGIRGQIAQCAISPSRGSCLPCHLWGPKLKTLKGNTQSASVLGREW